MQRRRRADPTHSLATCHPRTCWLTFLGYKVAAGSQGRRKWRVKVSHKGRFSLLKTKTKPKQEKQTNKPKPRSYLMISTHSSVSGRSPVHSYLKEPGNVIGDSTVKKTRENSFISLNKRYLLK